MDVIRFLSDFSVPFVTEGEHKHARPDWVNVECPFCTGNAGYHLGYNMADDYWFCWRCEWKPPLKTLHTLTGIQYHELKAILPAYGVNRSYVKKLPKGKKEFKLPSGIVELTSRHKKYLRSRGYDPFELEEVWGIQSTSPTSTLDKISYAYRVLFPFNWNGQLVSFDTRDVTGKQKDRYKACPKERERVEHKHILYGNQEAWGSTGIIVEGPTDVLRMGEHSAATSGIRFTFQQVRIIANTFKRAPVVFDDEPQAQRQAKKLVAELKFRGVDSWNVKIKGDPGNLSPREAKELRKTLLR